MASQNNGIAGGPLLGHAAFQLTDAVHRGHFVQHKPNAIAAVQAQT
jgi:hypothetical protein